MRGQAHSRAGDRILVIIMVLHALLYLGAWLLTLGVFTIVGWYVRYCLAVIAALLPVLGVVWFLWVWLVAIPMGLLFDGSPVEKNVGIISHWLNDRTGDLLLFFLTLPWHIIVWISRIAEWLVPGA
jgi:hypothetical protein